MLTTFLLFTVTAIPVIDVAVAQPVRAATGIQGRFNQEAMSNKLDALRQEINSCRANAANKCPDGQFMVAMDEVSCAPTCEPLPEGKEERSVIVGCSVGNDWCRNLGEGTVHPAPPGTRLYQTHEANAWDVPIGRRSFCALGFVSIGQVDPADMAVLSAGNFCRVLPVDSGDSPDTKPFWHIRVGSTGQWHIACHAVCIE